jgi:integrase
MVAKLFSDLVHECMAVMKNVGFSEKTIETYRSIWYEKVKPFMETNGEEYYSSQVGEIFLSSLPTDVMQTYNHLRRCITILNTVLETGSIKRYVPQKQSFDMSGEIGSIMLEFLSYKREHRVADRTLYVYERMLGRFLTFLRIKGIETLSTLTEQHLLDFVASVQINKSQRVFVLRGLCYYLVESKLVPQYFGTLIKGFRFPQKEKLPSVYTEEEIALIGNAINKSEFGGKRLYAVFMLASRLALRTSDIINLKFENIDWDKNCITLIQQKTERKIELPLTAEVGNAIVDYLKNEREVGRSNFIFITLKPPFEPVSRDTIYVGIQTAIYKSKIHVGKRHHGIHSMRHSLASKLLKDEQSLPMISSILGHASSQSTMNYLRVDLEGMKKCLLEVPQVPDSFYTQKGGIFYE